VTARRKTVAVIQARVGSTRLPSKVITPILGTPMIEHQIKRIEMARSVDEIVLATTDLPEDRPLVELAVRLGIHAFTGSENDVLNRVCSAGQAHGADVVMRLTGDCPLLDPAVIDWFADQFFAEPDIDYVSGDATLGDGLDVELMTMAAIEQAERGATRSYEREHVTTYLWQSGLFDARKISFEPDLTGSRWVVDEPADLEFATAVYEKLFPKHGYGFGVAEILDLLTRRPEIQALNGDIVRNEGFLEALRAERRGSVRMRIGNIENSNALWERARGLIPAGTQTLSKGPTQYVDGVAPKYIARAQGSHVWDVDGNEYIDYPMGLGAVILGHNYPATTAAITEQMAQGTSFSLMHPLEVEVAELLREVDPVAEMVRFGKNGSDATTGAVRVARAYTGRDKVAHSGYHGWHDWYVASTSRDAGIPESTKELQFSFEYNDLASLERLFTENPDEIAAVIMEPYGITLPEDGYLEGVRDITHKYGAVLIFDEVATGFRFQLGGIHQYFGVHPDLVCYGKSLGNGMPICVLAGRSEVMQVLENDVFYSFTAGGEALSLAAAKVTIEEMRDKDVIDHIWQMGRRLEAGFSRLVEDLALQDVVSCVGLAPRTALLFNGVGETDSLLVKSLFQQEIIKRGVIAVSAAHCISYSHSVDDIEFTLGVYQEALEVLAVACREGDIAEKIEGRPIQAVFRPIK
jgi:glutamate-1-semialdehyde aminotransferase/spore coat polysaccharide biosynthesis protein SpsF (cytidylyltransferase family)